MSNKKKKIGFRFWVLSCGLKIITFFPIFLSFLSAVPSTITNLQVTPSTSSVGQLKLQWTAPDNGFGGPVEGYLVKYSIFGDITNDTEFDTAITFYQNWTPLSPSQTEVKYLTGIIPDTTHWFSIKSYYSGVYSLISTTGTNFAIPQPYWLTWSSQESDDTYSICFGDYDNDGDLDILAGNSRPYLGQPNRLYSNNGDGTFTLVWSSPESDDTYSICFGDYDNDGDLVSQITIFMNFLKF